MADKKGIAALILRMGDAPEEEDTGDELDSGHEALVEAAGKVLDVLKGALSPVVSPDDSKASKEKLSFGVMEHKDGGSSAEKLAAALQEFFDVCDSLPHEEYGEEGSEEEEKE